MKKIFLVFYLFLPIEINTSDLSDVNKIYIADFFNKKVEEKKINETVTLTVYNPVSGQTDSTPNITASGYKISKDKNDKVIAVSRDMKKNGWDFGKKVLIEGANHLDGIYVIEDLLNKRFKKTVDVLIFETTKMAKFENVKITLL